MNGIPTEHREQWIKVMEELEALFSVRKFRAMLYD
jgi:hypothetical protein